MNMIMDSAHHLSQSAQASPQRAGDLHITTASPNTTLLSTTTHINNNTNTINNTNNINNINNINNTNNNTTNNNNNINITNNNNNNNSSSESHGHLLGKTNVTSGKATLKRSFDVAFLMMPDERIKQKQAEKQARLAEELERHHQYPTDLSPRALSQQQAAQAQAQAQQAQLAQQHLQQLHEHAEFFNLHEGRRYPQITIRSPRIYDDPSVVIPVCDGEPLPLKSAFTKVTSTRLESPVQPAPPLSPDQMSCPSMSPPVATTPPRTNSGNGSLSNGSSNSAPPCLNPSIVYQNFRPEYQFNGAFQSVSHAQALQAQRIKQQLFYRPPLNAAGAMPSMASMASMSSMSSIAGMTGSPNPNPNANPNHGSSNSPSSPSEFIPGYPGFPFPPGAAAGHPFAAVAPPELPRIVQNPAAAAILSTLIPPTLASTFTLTAQNVCAKCNISFRMTSDLVYHMRSHHKSEVACDPNRRKREEKLKCPVCQESFRERHHLTRHMTAHQDKESDQAPPASSAAANNEIINVGGGNGGRHYTSRVSGASK